MEPNLITDFPQVQAASIWGFVALIIISAAAQYFLRPRGPQGERAKPSELGDVQVTLTERGTPIPLVYGLQRIEGPTLLWYGAFKLIALDADGNVLGEGYDSNAAAYEYRLTLQYALCLGTDGYPVRLKRIQYGERILWSGDLDSGRVDLSQGGAVALATTDVNTTTDEITKTTHGMLTGDPIMFFVGLSGHTVPAPLTALRRYYAIRVDANKFKVALSMQDAIDGTAIDITATASTAFFVIGPSNTSLPVATEIRIDGSFEYSDGEYDVGRSAIVSEAYDFENALSGIFNKDHLPAYRGIATIALGARKKAISFAAGDVDTGTDTVTGSFDLSFTSLVEYQTGAAVIYVQGSAPIGGLTSGNTYYLIKTGDDSFQLATSKANAEAGTEINLTSQGTGTHQIYLAGALGFLLGRQPYLPQLSFWVLSAPNALGGTATVEYELNPATALYDLLTTRHGRLGLPTTDVETSTFTAGRDTLLTEKNGVGLTAYNQNDARQLVEEICHQIDGVLRFNPVTGKVELKLIRDDYTIGDLPVFNDDNVEDVEYTAGTWDGVYDEVAVKFRDREMDFRENTAFSQAPAVMVASHGSSPRLHTIYMPGVTNMRLAQTLASREKLALCRPWATVALICNRDAHTVLPGDPIVWTWPDYSITQMVLRVVRVSRGALEDGRVKIECVQDRFAQPAAGSGFPAVNPAPPAIDPGASLVSDEAILETPRWFQVLAERPDDPDKATVMYPVADPGTTTLDFKPRVQDGSVTASDKNPLPFTAKGKLQAQILRTTEPYDTASSFNVYQVVTPNGVPASTIIKALFAESTIRVSGKNIVLVGDPMGDHEFIGWEEVTDLGDGTWVLQDPWRGLLDTVPREWAANTPVYFVGHIRDAIVGTLEFDGDEALSVKLVPRGSWGYVSEDAVTAVALQLQQRAARPYPPKSVKLQQRIGKVLTTATNDTTAEAASGSKLSGYVVENELFGTWQRYDRLHAQIQRGDDGDDDPAEATQYEWDGRHESSTYSIAAASVNTTTDKLTRTAHGFKTGNKITYTLESGATAIGGLTAGSSYFIIRSSADEFQLATTLANAILGTAIDLTSQGSGNHVITQTHDDLVTAISAASGWLPVTSLSWNSGTANGEVRAFARHNFEDVFGNHTLRSLQGPGFKMILAHFRQLLLNPSFEDDGRGWTNVTGTPTFTTNGLDGGKCFGHGGAATQTIKQEVDVAALSLDELSTRNASLQYFDYAVNAADKVQVKLESLDKNSSVLDTYDSGEYSPVLNTWTLREQKLTLSAGVVKLRLTATIKDPGGGAPDTRLDNFTLQVGDVIGEPATALLSNPTFNVDLAGWTTLSGTWVRSTSTPLEGAGFLSCSASGEFYQQNVIGVGYKSAGDVLVVTVWRRDESGATGQIIVELRDSSDVVLLSKDSTAENVGSSAWVRRDFVLVMPANTDRWRIRFVGVNSGANRPWFDAIQARIHKGR